MAFGAARTGTSRINTDGEKKKENVTKTREVRVGRMSITLA